MELPEGIGSFGGMVVRCSVMSPSIRQPRCLKKWATSSGTRALEVVRPQKLQTLMTAAAKHKHTHTKTAHFRI